MPALYRERKHDRRVATLTCDKPDCRQSYVGGAGQTVQQVRAEAKKLAGWGVVPSFGADGHTDLCRWHA
jgi:hypothetical protein